MRINKRDKKKIAKSRIPTNSGIRDYKAQSLIEYMTLIGIIVSVLIVMSNYIGRGIQGMVKLVADQVGNQLDADQRSKPLNSEIEGQGYLINSQSISQSRQNRSTRQDLNIFNYIIDDTQRVDSESLTNLGFIEDKK